MLWLPSRRTILWLCSYYRRSRKGQADLSSPEFPVICPRIETESIMCSDGLTMERGVFREVVLMRLRHTMRNREISSKLTFVFIWEVTNACSKILKFNCPDVDGKQDEALQEDSCRWMDWENNLRAFAYEQTCINALILNLWHQIFCIEMFKWCLIILNQKTFFCGYWSFWNPSSIQSSLKLSNTFSSHNLWWKPVATAQNWPSLPARGGIAFWIPAASCFPGGFNALKLLPHWKVLFFRFARPPSGVDLIYHLKLEAAVKEVSVVISKTLGKKRLQQDSELTAAANWKDA